MRIKLLAATALIGIAVVLIVLILIPRAGVAAPPAQATPAPLRGAALFNERCSACHGSDAEGTKIAPALKHVDDHSDEELFQIITEGRKGTAMPAWGGKLSAEQIRGLVQYLRSLAGTMAHTGMTESPPPLTSAATASLSIALGLDSREDGTIVARATVRDDHAQPVANVPVVFHLQTALGGHLEIASAQTDAQGVAGTEYRAGAGRNVTLEASVGKASQAVTASANATIPGEEEWTPEPLISPSPPIPLIAVLATLLGGIWLTYAFIGVQLTGIFRKT